jgi:hypothetical protein
MSYVIQHFNDFNKRVAMTPRFRFLLFFNNLNKFFIFLKYNTFLFFINKSYSAKINYFFLFDKFFYSRQYFKYLYYINFELVGAYDNNFLRSTAYSIFNEFNRTNFNNTVYLSKVLFSLDDTFYFFNLFLTPIRVINLKLQKTFYKNVFFYLMLIFPQIWMQKQKNFKFYLNFILTFYNLKIFRFYSGYFLRTYNF